MRKKHEQFKNIRWKDEHFKYFLFDVSTAETHYAFIHKETQIIEDIDEYVENKFEAIYDYFQPRPVEIEISPLGQWEYNSLNQAGTKKLMKLWKN